MIKKGSCTSYFAGIFSVHWLLSEIQILQYDNHKSGSRYWYTYSKGSEDEGSEDVVEINLFSSDLCFYKHICILKRARLWFIENRFMDIKVFAQTPFWHVWCSCACILICRLVSLIGHSYASKNICCVADNINTELTNSSCIFSALFTSKHKAVLSINEYNISKKSWPFGCLV